MKLTAKQYAVLLRLSTYPSGARVCEVAGVIEGKHPYLARALTRSVLRNLVGKGLCRLVNARPKKYQVTERGWLVLA